MHIQTQDFMQVWHFIPLGRKILQKKKMKKVVLNKKLFIKLLY